MDLSQLGAGQFVLVAIGGLAFLLILAVITLLVRGRLVLKRKDTSIEFDVRKGDKKPIVIDPSDPASKPLKLSGRHVLLIVEKTTEIIEERSRIELIEILRAQLNYAEQKLSFTKNTMKQAINPVSRRFYPVPWFPMNACRCWRSSSTAWSA